MDGFLSAVESGDVDIDFLMEKEREKRVQRHGYAH